jgi:hypothetical protein
MLWAALVIMFALAAQGAGLWYSSRLYLAGDQARQWQLFRLVTVASAGVGVAILVVGVIAFVRTGHNWFVLAAVWSYGLVYLVLLRLRFRRTQKIRRGAGGPR